MQERSKKFASPIVLGGCLLAGAAAAQTPPPDGAASAATTTLPTVEVIGTSPLLGSGIDRDKVPANVRSFSDRDLRQEGAPDLTGTLERRVPGVTVNDVQANPFQPDVQFRGFDASPVLGTPQGLAVYQNGVRINEAFGDTVNWDLVPEVAIDRTNLVSNNPVFGLNALGGALALEMKNGFTFQGFEGDVRGGSFGRRAGSAQYGMQVGRFGAYVAGEALNEDGWRDFSPSELRRMYADLGAKGERLELHVAFTGASNRFGAIGPAPVELLNQRRENVYTTPQTYRNNLSFVTVTGSYQATDTLALQSNFYWRAFRQHVNNGNTSDVQACDAAVAPGTLCLDDPTTILFATTGSPVADVLGGGVPGSVDRSSTFATGLGGSVQATDKAALLGHENNFVVGASLDHGDVSFNASSELGIVGSDLFVNGTGIIIDQPAGDIAPTRLNTTNNYYGLYATDTFNVTPALAVTAGGRYNLAQIRLSDQLGTALNGTGRYSRFNPAAGATYKITPGVTAYAGYSEANRAPTPAELGCADPLRPCTLEGFLVSDPPLKQVVARTYEAGLRGGFALGEGGGAGRLSWNLGLFRTDSSDDIINVASPITGRGFFQNAGDTRRQGIEAGANFRSDNWSVYLDYSLVDATFESTLTLLSPNNPAAPGGVITVQPGDHLPSIPQHRLKGGAVYSITANWKLGADIVFASDQYFRGDEANQNPKLPGYWVVNLHSSYQVTDNFEIFGVIQNLFDQHYETFGTYTDPTQVPFLGLSDPRTVSPAAPLAVFAGIRVTF